MEILFSKESVDVTNELIKKITSDIEKLTSITEDNILSHQKKIFNDYELEPLSFDINKINIEFNKVKPVPVHILLRDGVSYDNDDLFFGTIYLSGDLLSGTTSLLFNKPIDFIVNRDLNGYVDKNKIKVEFPTSIYNVDPMYKEDIDRFKERKKVLKNYLIDGINEINKAIPSKNIETKEKISELLNAKKVKLKAIEERNKFLNE